MPKKRVKAPAVEAYCLKCQKSRKIKPGHTVIQLVNGRKLRRGECTECGTKTSTMVSKDTPADIIEKLPKEAKAKVKKGTASGDSATRSSKPRRRRRSVK